VLVYILELSISFKYYGSSSRGFFDDGAKSDGLEDQRAEPMPVERNS